MYFASWCSMCFCIVLFDGFCTGHFVMVPLNFTHFHRLQHSFFKHRFNIYLTKKKQGPFIASRTCFICNKETEQLPV